jgi:apolipoprotein N-acyltransferase
LSRVAVHRLHVPTILAAPIVWTGLELARAHLLTGFLMASLAHTQYKWTAIIQISDLAGAYGVTFLVMLVAACVARMLPIELHRPAVWPLAPLVAVMTAALCYGYWRMDAPQGPLAPKIAMIQGNINTVFGGDPEAQREEIRSQYKSISEKAMKEHPEIELLVWPESMYWIPHVVLEPDAWLPAEMLAGNTRLSPEVAQQYQDQKKLPALFAEFSKASRRELRRTVAELGGKPLPEAAADASASTEATNSGSAAEKAGPLGPALLLGMDTEHYVPGGVRRYSSSVCVDGNGNVASCYHKMHPVLFGEYVPLGDYIPALYALTPLPGGLSVGDGPKVFDLGGIRVSPNICYETVMPHLIRGQVDTLRRSGTEPDLLITQTNDGWFRGSSALDMHMVCSVFRAVECRKPMMVAANTGISAVINGSGQIVGRVERGEQNYLLTDVHLDTRYSPYVRYGDTLGIACAGACALLLLVALADRFLLAGRARAPLAPGST